jgi:cytochrome c oxidase subunit 1
MGFMGGLFYWWPKMFGKMYSENAGRIASIIIFLGFNLTFFPQFLLGYMGMPRRYHVYPPEFQVFNVLSSAGASILGLGFILVLCVLVHSLIAGEPAGDNPWGATTLEWQTSSPPIAENFEVTPVVTHEAYTYSSEEVVHVG